jgi:ABC-type lipoprotein export system ATPase subunit
MLSFRGVSKIYRSSEGAERWALKGVSFDVESGRRVSIIGRSGSGKSTLLHLAAGLDVPSQGEVLVDGRNIGALSDEERTLLRRRRLGLVFQFFHLLPHLSVIDNVALPGFIAHDSPADLAARARRLLARVGLEDRARDPVQKLSGGEMQRVAICRALLAKPALLLADEPTGNLDDANGRLVLDLLLDVTREEGAALIFVTHSRELAARADAVWELHRGVLAR